MLAIIAYLSDIFYFIKKFFTDFIAKITGKDVEEETTASQE